MIHRLSAPRQAARAYARPTKIALVVALIALAACEAASSRDSAAPASTAASSDPQLDSIQLALLQLPDARTQDAMRVLARSLTADEATYLQHMRFDGLDSTALASDRVFRKAAASLQSSATGTRSVHALTLHPLDSADATSLVGKARAAMTECYGTATCNDPGCVAAVTRAVIDVYGPIGGPAPTDVVDKGTWSCVQTYFGADAGGGSKESCTFVGYCKMQEITYSKDKPPVIACKDAGWVPGPRANCPFAPPRTPPSTGSSGSTASSSGASGASSGSSGTSTSSCSNGAVFDQCAIDGLPPNNVTCIDGSIPAGCEKSLGYMTNGGILCCSDPI
jgi:hypothetical protein